VISIQNSINSIDRYGLLQS